MNFNADRHAVYDPEAMERFGYDACVEIIDQASFLSRINSSIAEMADYVGTGACQYLGRGFSYWDAGTFAPYLLKDPSYAYQCEARALWQPNQAWLAASGKLIDQSGRLSSEDPIPPYTLDPLILDLAGLGASVRIL